MYAYISSLKDTVLQACVRLLVMCTYVSHFVVAS